MNKTQMQTLNLMTTMMESRAQDQADNIGNFFQQDGSAFGGKAPAGLALIVDNDRSARPTAASLVRPTLVSTRR